MIIQCDASQLEWRTALQLSQDPVGIKEVVENQDAHSLNQAAFNLPSRLIAKIYLFRTIFRGSGYAFSVDPAFSHVSNKPAFWDDVNEQFYRKYNGLDATHKEWCDLVVAGRDIVGPTGRAWTIPMGTDYNGNRKIPWTTLTNYPVQGTGADAMMIARISFWRRLSASKLPVKLVSTVHDSIVVDAPASCVTDVVRLMYEVFDDLVKNINLIFKCDWNVPLACEVKIGPNQKDQRKVDRNGIFVV